MTKEPKLLDGIRIADFSWIFAAPIATKFLGDYGAEVIKIESPKRPDDSRTVGPFRGDRPGVNTAAMFALYNSSKYGITLDFEKKEALEIAKQLVSVSDIVIESFRAGIMKKLGLDYDTLKTIKKDIIMLSSTIYGQTGPASVQALLGTFFQSEAGFVHLLGWPDRSPSIVPNPYTDYIPPMFIISALLAALDYRERTGKGQYIDISQIETSPHFLGPTLLDYQVNRREQKRAGNRSDRAVPHGVFPCLGDERYCALAVENDDQWRRFRSALGDPPWSRDDAFSTFLGRKKNEAALEKHIENHTRRLQAEEVVSALLSHGIAASVVRTGRDLMERDEQMTYRKAFVETNHPEMGTCIVQQPPFRFSDHPACLKTPPCVGEHTAHVCNTLLGMDDDTFTALVAKGVFG